MTLRLPEALHWRVKSSGVRQSEITKGPVLASQAGKPQTRAKLFKDILPSLLIPKNSAEEQALANVGTKSSNHERTYTTGFRISLAILDNSGNSTSNEL